MARSPTRRARPANPPATPPAIAAAFGDELVDSPTAAAFGDVLVDSGLVAAFGDVLADFETVGTAGSIIWYREISVDTLPEFEAEVAKPVRVHEKDEGDREEDGAGDEDIVLDIEISVASK